MKDVVASRLTGIDGNPFQFDKPYAGQPLNLFEPVTPDEVFKLLGTIPSKSSPMDFVPTSVLKTCKRVFAPLIARLANLSFQEGRFPNRFKQAQVTPLLKHEGDDVSNPANYRPISNLNTISKVIERLALARLRQHITQSPNFNTLQSAYRRHHSTETALLRILNDVYGKMDEGRSTLLVALDLSAAFDTVDHSVLLSRLERSFGIQGSILTWIKSYLVDRTQFVRLGTANSVATNCLCGVPQGSVLGPLLFVAYISSTANIAEHFGIGHHQYADDTQVYVALSRNDVTTAVANLHNGLAALHRWFSQNGLVINPDKSEVVLFATTQQTRISPLPLKEVDVAGCSVPLSESVKILGVTLDRHLTFNTHVQNVCKSVHYHTRALRHIRSSLSTDMARTVACALVNSRLDYANSVLYGTTASNIAKLQRAQNALSRVVTYTRRTEHIRPVLQNLHWLPISYRIEYKVATLAYKVRTTGSPVYLNSLVRDYTPTRELRSSSLQLLATAPARTATARRAFSQAAPSVWNSLPYDVRTAETFERFKSTIRTHLYRRAFC